MLRICEPIIFDSTIKRNEIMTTREKARQQNVKVNSLLKIYKQNTLAGQKFSFEYKRYIIGQIQYRDQLWKAS